jgi:ATP-dependent helicase/nuclease subunit A
MTIHQAKGLEFPLVVVPDFAAEGGGAFPPPVAWDGRLGCVPRPPADEDPPPFPEFAWRVHRAAEELHEWHEDLRALYVACTRPRDYLVLSAALGPGEAARGPWMQTLSRRFDVATGACLAADVPAERRPRVNVVDATCPPPAPAVRERTSAAIPSAPPEVRPLPSPAGEVLDLSEAERRMEAADSLFAGQPAAQQDEPASRLLRRVLDRWDFRDAEGWRGPLGRLAAGEGLPAGELERLGRVLERFARSVIGQHLRGASAVRRRLEFVSRPDEVAVGGVIDCALRDEAGRWELLFWVTTPVPESGREEAWSRRLAALTLASSAWREQTGAWPHGAGLVFVQEAEALVRPAGRLPHGSVAARLRA